MKKDKIIYDTNVIIDFKAGGIRESIFMLDEIVAINRAVYIKELKKERKYLAPHILDGKFEIIERNDEIEEILEELKKYKTKSTDIYDLIGLACAIYLKSTFATGDAGLRAAAKKEEVSLTGSIGIAKKMVLAGFNVEEMIKAFSLMKERNRRIPWELAKSELEKLRKKTA